MLFLDRQDALDHGAGGRIVVAEVADQFAVVIDRDALGDQVLADHGDQGVGGDVFRGRLAGQVGRIEVGDAAQLVDALGHLHGVALLVLGVLLEFRLDPFAGQAGRDDGVLGVAQDTDQFRRQHRLQDVDRHLHVAPIGVVDRTLVDMFASAVSQGLDIA